MSTPSLALRLRQNNRPYGYHGLKIITSLCSVSLIFSDGHDVGDQVLINVAERIRACIRSTDLVSRIGGDEFLIIMFNQSAKTQFSIAKKLIHSIHHPVRIDQKISVNIGVSIGIANTPRHAQKFDDLVKAADEAMYEVKRLGRNGYGIKINANKIKVTLF